MQAREIARMDAGSIRFAFPSNWERQVEETEDGLSIVLQSPGVTFLIVGVYSADAEPEDLVLQALDSLREEHPALEVEEQDEGTWADGVGMEAVFMSLDTVAYAWIRGGRAGRNSVLFFMQTVERESAQSEALFRAICESVTPIDD